MGLLEGLLAEIDKIPILDTHEHLMPEGQRLRQKLDVFYLFGHYVSSDSVSAGLPIRKWPWLWDSSQSLAERWALFSPYWERVRHLAHGRAILTAVRDLSGIDDLNDGTYEAVCDALTRSQNAGWYRHVLRERAGIELSIQDIQSLDIDRELFVPVMRCDPFIMVCCRRELWALEDSTGVAIHGLDDLLRSVDAALEAGVRAGMAALKMAVAYCRPLQFAKVTRHEAEVAFNQITCALDPLRVSICGDNACAWDELRPLQDYTVYHIVRRSIELHVPIQVHTGYQEGNSNYITNSNPVLLASLLMEYPAARFDVFHGGYPYWEELTTLAKNFPNVFIDMCWLHILSPTAARQALHVWLEAVPLNKIMGFGGDYGFVEGSYGHSRIARYNIARVLTEKVEEGYFTEEQALLVARRLLHDNACDLFGLGAP